MTATTIAKFGKFEFALRKGVPIPETAPRTRGARQEETPYLAFFAVAEHNDELFVPQSFFTSPKTMGGRGIPASTATTSYMRGKIRDAFNRWKDKAEAHKTRSLVLFPRKKGDQWGRDEEYPEDGFSVFIQITPQTAAEAAPQGEAPAGESAEETKESEAPAKRGRKSAAA